MINLFSGLLAQTESGTAAPTGADNRYSELFTEHRGTYWFPEQASSFAGEVDWLFMLVFWISLVFFAGFVGAMAYFAIRYRHRPGHRVEKSPTHNTALEIAWSVLPGFLLVWFFVDGARGFLTQQIAPGDCEEIRVLARQFNWIFYYPDGDSSEELHLVRNRPVKFIMESEDVLHSLFIPAFRQKQDVVPGRYSYSWSKPIRTGTYRLFCTEYCGRDHSLMKTIVTVHETEAERKAATAYDWEGNDAISNGERLFRMQCSGCHNATTEAKTGPGLAGIWGNQETLDNGQTITVDDQYFQDSIMDPNKHIVQGFPRPSPMTSFEGKLTPEQTIWLRIYIKSLSNVTEEPPAEEEDAAAEETVPPADAESGNGRADDPADDGNGEAGNAEPGAGSEPGDG